MALQKQVVKTATSEVKINAGVEAVSIPTKTAKIDTNCMLQIDGMLKTRGLKLLVQVVPIKGNRNKCINIQFTDGKPRLVMSASSTATPDDVSKELVNCNSLLAEFQAVGI